MSNFLERHKKKSLLALLWFLISKPGKGFIPLLAVLMLAGYLGLSSMLSDSASDAETEMAMPWPKRLAAAIGLDRLLGYGKLDSSKLAKRNAGIDDALRQARANAHRGLNLGAMLHGWGSPSSWFGGRGGGGAGRRGAGGQYAGMSGLDLVRGGSLPADGLPGWDSENARGDVIKGGGSGVNGIINSDDARNRASSVAMSPDEADHGWVRSVQAGEFANYSGGGAGASGFGAYGGSGSRLGGWENVGHLSGGGSWGTSSAFAARGGGGFGMSGGAGGYGGAGGGFGGAGGGGAGGGGGGGGRWIGGGGGGGGGGYGYGGGGGGNGSGNGNYGGIGSGSGFGAYGNGTGYGPQGVIMWTSNPTGVTQTNTITVPSEPKCTGSEAALDSSCPMSQLSQCRAATFTSAPPACDTGSCSPDLAGNLNGACYDGNNTSQTDINDPNNPGLTLPPNTGNTLDTNLQNSNTIVNQVNQCEQANPTDSQVSKAAQDYNNSVQDMQNAGCINSSSFQGNTNWLQGLCCAIPVVSMLCGCNHGWNQNCKNLTQTAKQKCQALSQLEQTQASACPLAGGVSSAPTCN